jgi:porphobilinogen synthase
LSGLPLGGRRILVTRPRAQAGDLCSAIGAAGGEAILIPAIEIGDDFDHGGLDLAIGELDRYDWIVFTSANAVEAFFSRVDALAASGRAGEGRRAAAADKRIAAIGPATERALRGRSAKAVAIPGESVSEAIAESLGEIAGMRILIPRSDLARKSLGEDLRARGASVDEVLAYVTSRAEKAPESAKEIERGFDAVIFASPSAARGFAAISGGPARLRDALIACIGPATAEEAEKIGYRVGLVAERHSAEGLVEALVRHYDEAAAASGAGQRSEYMERTSEVGTGGAAGGSVPGPRRPRRLRLNAGIRRMVRETSLSADDFIYPLFVTHGKEVRDEIASMPGVFQWSIDNLAREAESIARAGIPAVLLFGLPAVKDAIGSENFAEDGIVQRAIRELKRSVPELAVVTDVCLCEYTESGHCGLLNRGEAPGLPEAYVLNDETLPVLARVALSHAEAGADIVAPSGMIDGMVASIRSALDAKGWSHVPILSYAVKYASAFYGPFRDAAGGAPAFGDRTSHQMDPANAREALREAALDVEEGADMLMVKPALAYLDVIRQTRERFPEMPLGAYNVSGEYAMVKAGARNGWIDERRVVMEVLTGIKRAGADFIITYHAKDAAQWLR